ncbi:hypothetical protein KP509_02G054700 [Ceratopteris richardii]|nr:hypothetical protein KP509_02G054700 [Ceratopteris richardii]
MRQKSLFPNEACFVGLLKSCIQVKDVRKGSTIHADIVSEGLLQKDSHLGNLLVDMYAKSGSIAKAQEVFYMLPRRNVVTWTTLINGYFQSSRIEEALLLYDKMQAHGVSPNSFTFACVLKCCTTIGALNIGLETHVEVARRGLVQVTDYLSCTLVDMYSKFGLLEKAQEVFDSLSSRDVATWTALLTGYAQNELGEEAINCFNRMESEDIFPNAFTYSACVKACGSTKNAHLGAELHVETSRKGLLQGDHVLGSAFVDMYAKCGLVRRAQEVFQTLDVHDVISWNALIAGYLHHQYGEEALQCYEQMQASNVSPDSATFSLALNACSIIQDSKKGMEIHHKITESGLLGGDAVLGNALVEMYAACGMLLKAKEVFDELPRHDVGSWAAFISGLIEHNNDAEALASYQQMIQEAVLPDAMVFTLCLKACTMSGALRKGIEFHGQIAENGVIQNVQGVGNALLDMYAKCSMVHRAQEVFNELHTQDVFSWSKLIAAYAEQNLCEEAVKCFRNLQQIGILPDSVTLTHLLKACSSIGNMSFGTELHLRVEGIGQLNEDILLNNALIDMYAKCGMLKKARDAFNRCHLHDDIAWTAMITSYAQQGRIDDVFRILYSMKINGNKLNSITFISVLTACSHVGYVEEGMLWFDAMVRKYLIPPTLEHYTCMVDLLGRAGQLEKAVDLIKRTPFHSNIELWLTIMGACHKGENVDIARYAFHQVILLDETCTSAYICMYNIFCQAGMHEDAMNIEALRIKRHAPKKFSQ